MVYCQVIMWLYVKYFLKLSVLPATMLTLIVYTSQTSF
jgi:hypothetical protein